MDKKLHFKLEEPSTVIKIRLPNTYKWWSERKKEIRLQYDTILQLQDKYTRNLCKENKRWFWVSCVSKACQKFHIHKIKRSANFSCFFYWGDGCIFNFFIS